MAKKSSKSGNNPDKRLSELDFKENELDSRLDILELKERELELEISKLKFVMKKKQELIERNIISAPQKKPKAEKAGKKRKAEEGIDEERKSVLTRQIKSVLKKKEEAETEEELKKKILDSKKLIDKEKISVVTDGESDDMRLFKLIVDKKSVRVDEAAEILELDKKTVKAIAKELKKDGLISISKPFYGEQVLNLEIVPTQDITKMLGSRNA